MLDIKFIRENKKAVEKNCKNRGVKCDIGRLLELDEKRKKSILKIENYNAEKNLLNDKFVTAKNNREKAAIAYRGKEIK